MEGSPAYAEGSTEYNSTSDASNELSKELSAQRELRFLSSMSRAGSAMKRNIKLGRLDAASFRTNLTREQDVRTRDSYLRQHNERTAFDIVNLKYKSTPEGKRLELHDKLVQYRSKLRALTIAKANHIGFNPITGVQSLVLDPPTTPLPT